MRPLRIMRVIPRMNVGASARQVGRLMRGLDPQLFHQRLYVGAPDPEDRHYRQLRLPDVRTYSLPTLGRSGWPSDHARALAALPSADRRAQRPGLVMAAIYQALLRRIEQDGFHVLDHRIALTPLAKAWIAWKTSWAY